VDSLEGVLAHFVGDEELARRAAESDAPIATDDLNSLEFGFARGVGRRKDAQVADDVILFAKNQNLGRPALFQGDVDWDKVAALEPSTEGVLNVAAQPMPGESPLRKAHREFLDLYVSSRYSEADRYVENAKLEPLNPVEREALAEIAVLAGKDPGTVLEEIGFQRPMDEVALRGMLLAGELHFSEAADLLIRAFESWQQDPWVSPNLASHALAAAQALARRCNDPAIASRIYDTLRTPFAVELVRERRLLALVEVAKYTAPERLNARVREALAAYDSFPLWRKDFLEQRVRTYGALNDSHMERAALELRDFLDHEPVRFDSGLRKSDATVATR